VQEWTWKASNALPAAPSDPQGSALLQAWLGFSASGGEQCLQFRE
jgi:hypothetical protein